MHNITTINKNIIVKEHEAIIDKLNYYYKIHKIHSYKKQSW